MGDYDALSPTERQRLERFAAAFEQLDASSYVTLAEARPSPNVDRAQTDALQALGTGSRRKAVRDAVTAFVNAAATAYSRRFALPDTVLLFQSLPDRAEDRVRFLTGLERAVAALILWDELPEDDRQALGGVWVPHLEAVVAGSTAGR
jgi:hypothetical protein